MKCLAGVLRVARNGPKKESDGEERTAAHRAPAAESGAAIRKEIIQAGLAVYLVEIGDARWKKLPPIERADGAIDWGEAADGDYGWSWCTVPCSRPAKGEPSAPLRV